MGKNEGTTTVMGNQEFAIQKFQHAHFAELTTLTDNDGNIWFVGKEVAEKLGYINPLKAVRDRCKGVNSTVIPTQGGNQSVNIIPESDFYRLVMRSQLEKAEDFQDWVCEEVLPTIRKTGTYNHKPVSDNYKPAIANEKFETTMIGVKYAAEILKTSEVSKVMMIRKTFEIYGLETAMLPQYIENVRLTFSATELLNRKDYGLKVKGFNKLMIEKGFLEIKKRKGSAGKIKEFKALTDLGLQYGNNDQSPQSPLEVQPHYFEDCFPDLVGRVAA